MRFFYAWKELRESPGKVGMWRLGMHYLLYFDPAFDPDLDGLGFLWRKDAPTDDVNTLPGEDMRTAYAVSGIALFSMRDLLSEEWEIHDLESPTVRDMFLPRVKSPKKVNPSCETCGGSGSIDIDPGESELGPHGMGGFCSRRCPACAK